MPFHIQYLKKSLDSSHLKESIQARILESFDAYEALATPAQKSQWIQDEMLLLDEEVGEAEAKRIMQNCGRQCIGRSMLDKAIKLQKAARDLDDLLDRLNHAHIGGGKLLRKGNKIHASYDRCYCGSVSKSRLQIPLTYCHCSCGWYQQLFETLLGKPVEVQLIDAIAHGAQTCQFVIHI